MNRELTQDECRDQRTLLKILERNKLAEWLGGAEFYEQVICNLDAMQQTGTTDGEDLAELTDEDAKERPWVMVRMANCDPYTGPHRLIAATMWHCGFVTATCEGCVSSWAQCRRATENELKQAGITK